MRFWKALSLFFLIVLGLVAYCNGLDHPFMIDDHGFFDVTKKDIKNLPVFLVPDRSHFMKVAGAGHDDYYRPLAHIVPMLTALIFKDNALGYHVVNLILFILAAWALLFLIKDITGSTRLGMIAASLYLVHPINTLVVNYKTASVFGAQVILMLVALRYAYRYSNIAVVYFLLAILCHETAMVLPFYAMAILFYGRRETLKESFHCTIPLWIALGAYGVFRVFFATLSKGILSHYGLFHMNVLEFLATAFNLASWYLSKFFIPSGIVMIYSSPVLRGIEVGAWLFIALVLAALIAYALRSSRLTRLAKLGLVWILLGFLPFLPASLFQPSRQVLLIEPHWFVFSSIGFFIVIADLLSRCWDKTRRFGIVAVALTTALLTALSWNMNAQWVDEINYCQFWLKESPSFSAIHTVMGRAYKVLGQNEMSRRELQLGLTEHPKDQYEFFMATGLMDLEDRNYDRALEEFNGALKLNPGEPMVYNNLGAVQYRKGNLKIAKKYFEKALELDPKAQFPFLNLQKIEAKEKQLKEWSTR